MNAYPIRDRLRMYLLVTLMCAALALLLQLFLRGTGEFQNYAERQLEETARAAVQAERADMARSGAR